MNWPEFLFGTMIGAALATMAWVTLLAHKVRQRMTENERQLTEADIAKMRETIKTKPFPELPD